MARDDLRPKTSEVGITQPEDLLEGFAQRVRALEDLLLFTGKDEHAAEQGLGSPVPVGLQTDEVLPEERIGLRLQIAARPGEQIFVGLGREVEVRWNCACVVVKAPQAVVAARACAA